MGTGRDGSARERYKNSERRRSWIGVSPDFHLYRFFFYSHFLFLEIFLSYVFFPLFPFCSATGCLTILARIEISSVFPNRVSLVLPWLRMRDKSRSCAIAYTSKLHDERGKSLAFNLFITFLSFFFPFKHISTFSRRVSFFLFFLVRFFFYLYKREEKIIETKNNTTAFLLFPFLF